MARTQRTEDDIAKERDEFERIRSFMRDCSLATLRDLANATSIALEIRTPKRRKKEPDVQTQQTLIART